MTLEAHTDHPSDTTTAAASTGPARSHAAPRLDLYAAMQKGLRFFMADTLARVGWLDVQDADEMSATLAQVQRPLDLCRSHLDHKNRFVHTALEARCPSATLRIAGEHDAHLDALWALEADAAALRALPGAAAAHRFYRHLALFVAQSLEHMNVEETAHNNALWASQRRRTGGRPPAPGGFDRVGRDGRRAALDGARDGARRTRRHAWRDAAASSARSDARVLDTVRPHLHDRAWGKLARAVGIPGVPRGTGR